MSDKERSPVLQMLGDRAPDSAGDSACASCPAALWSATPAGQITCFCRFKHQDTFTSTHPREYIEFCDGPFAMEELA